MEELFTKMKICWDNLENLYITKYGYFRNRKTRTTYVYIDECKCCKEPFLAQKQLFDNGKGIFCSWGCSNNGENHPRWGKHISNSAKKKITMFNSGLNHWRWDYYFSNNIPTYDKYINRISYAEECRHNLKDKNILEVKCTYCGKWYIPTGTEVTSRIMALNGNIAGEYRLYCSNNCKRACSIYRRHKYPKGFKPATSREVQPQLRQLVFERDNYTCQKCGKTVDEIQIHCHHVDPVSQNPIESADIDNCVTLCKDCHKWVHKQSDCKYNELKCLED